MAKKWMPYYEMALVPEHYILKQIIYNNPNQKVFNILDIGVGKFWTLDTLAKVINSLINEQDIQFNLVRVRAEPNFISLYNEDSTDYYSKIEHCNLYKLGSFACENLINELRKHELSDLIGKFDFIFTEFTIIHLVDPIGLVKQMHDSLNDNGIMMFDNHFKYKIISNDQLLDYDEINMAWILSNYFYKAGDEVLLFSRRISDGIVTIIKKHGIRN